MPPHAPAAFINLPVSDLGASEPFYTALGFKKNPTWSSDDTTCMVLSPTIAVMLMQHPRFKSCTQHLPAPSALPTPKPVLKKKTHY